MLPSVEAQRPKEGGIRGGSSIRIKLGRTELHGGARLVHDIGLEEGMRMVNTRYEIGTRFEGSERTVQRPPTLPCLSWHWPTS